MNSHRFVAAAALTVALLAGIPAVKAQAQSQIWNVPTTDTAQAKSKYLEADLIANLRSYKNSAGFTAFGARAIFGLNNRSEIGVNFFGTESDPPSACELQLNGKYSLYNNARSGIAAAIGTNIYLPVVNRSSGDTFAMTYLVISKKFPGFYAPRISAGAWTLVNHASGTGSRDGLMFGYEQQFSHKVGFGLDWSSGDQTHGGFSALSAGLFTQVGKNGTLGTGYTWGNKGRNNNALIIFYGLSF